MATATCVVRVLNRTSILARSSLRSFGTRHRCLMTTATPNTGENVPKPEGSESKDKKTEASTKSEDVIKLESQVQKLEEEVKESKDKYMRSLAEAENLRRRMTKQVEDAKLFGIQGFCKDLLEVSDILNTAINTVPKTELKDSNPHLINLFQGLNMTESQLIKVFNKHGLESIAPKEGEKFDPNFHEALFQVPIQSKETQTADTVAVVQKIGYKLHSRTLRPALVGVFKAS